jgi:hypothetical protein
MAISTPMLVTFLVYIFGMILIGFLAWRSTKNFDDYILGGRSLGPMVTALSAGASDMSGWLLMGLPGAIFISGISESWIAIGLTVGAWVNWKLVAGRLRVHTEVNNNALTLPHVTHFDKTDITDLEAFRKQQNAEAEKRKLDVKFTPVVFIMKAVAAALEQMPRFNSSLSEDGQKLTLKKYINIGVAVDTPNGLVVPVFKDVNKKSITELSRELTVISKKARDGKLTAGEMQGGCFTISSIGGLGTTHFAPIVNAPEVAILGVSKSAMGE